MLHQLFVLNQNPEELLISAANALLTGIYNMTDDQNIFSGY